LELTFFSLLVFKKREDKLQNSELKHNEQFKKNRLRNLANP